uniref:Uncharacterized protein n=1 Tax=Arundo donax TaxID=35708 RepID=A0A0A9HM17_ARUDO
MLMFKFNEINQLTHKNANDMFSRLNVIMNEINGLDVKKLGDGDVMRKILQTLRRLEYDLIVSILHDKHCLDNTIPSKMLSKIIAYELNMRIVLSTLSNTKSLAFTSGQSSKNKMRKHELSSSEDEDEESEEELDLEVFQLMVEFRRNIARINHKVKKK